MGSSFGILGLIGVLAFMAGAHLLWKVRFAAMAWLDEFIRLLRTEFARRELSSAHQGSATSLSRPRSGALILMAALTLILIGPLLVLLDLTAF
jgi:hypothetical protein